MSKGLDFSDIEALVRNAYYRGVDDTTADLEEKHHENLTNACRGAWDEGCGAGRDQSRFDLLRFLDLEFGKVMRMLEQAIVASSFNERATKAELRKLLDYCVQVLRILVQAHHDGFPDKRIVYRDEVAEICQALDKITPDSNSIIHPGDNVFMSETITMS